MTKCGYCSLPMNKERFNAGFKLCVRCSNTQRYLGFQVFPHKTGGECVLVNPNDSESIRQAERANRRSR